MSAYKKIECDIVDKDTLLEALKLLGFSPDVLNEPKNLTGYRGDERKEVAHIIIPRDQVNKFTGASNDIGFFWNEAEEKYIKKGKLDEEKPVFGQIVKVRPANILNARQEVFSGKIGIRHA